MEKAVKKTRNTSNVRKVRTEGGTTVLTLGRGIIPEGWSFVELHVVETTEDAVTVVIKQVK